MNRRLLASLGLILLTAGCSSQSPGSSTLVPSLTKTYSDKQNNFSFQYPASWTVGSHGAAATGVGGTQSYVVHMNIPSNAAGMEVTVNNTVTPFPPINNGEVRKDPSGPNFFRYFNKKVSGLTALRVERFYQGKTDQVTTIIDGSTHSYDVRMLTGTPPFKSSVLTGYNLVVSTLKLPFS